MKRTYVIPTNLSGSIPKYWREGAFNEKLNAQQETVLAVKLADIETKYVGDELEVTGAGIVATFYVTGIYKAGFDYNGGKVKPGYIVFTLRAQRPATVGHAGFAVQGLTGVTLANFANPQEAILQVPKPKAADLPENIYATANFFERMLPVAIGAALLYFVFKLASKFIK